MSARRWRPGSSPDLASKVAANFLDYHVLARRDHGNIARLAADLGDAPAAARAPARR